MKVRIDDEITFRKLEVFLAFMQTGSLAKASELLDTTPVSVHRALHSLEEGLRCALFRNEGRNLIATPAAQVLAETAREVIDQMARGISVTRAAAGFASDLLRIGSLYSLTARVIPQVIMDVKMRRPDLRIELILGSNDDLLGKLRRAQIDAVLMGVPAEDSQLETIRLFEDDIFFAMPADAAQAAPSEVDLRDFAAADFVSLSNGFVTYHGFVEAFRIAQFEPRVVAHADDIFSLMSLVAGGVGYTLLPGRVRNAFGNQVRLVPLQARYRMRQTIGLTFQHVRERDPNLLALAAVCRLGGRHWNETPGSA